MDEAADGLRDRADNKIKWSNGVVVVLEERKGKQMEESDEVRSQSRYNAIDASEA